MPTVKELFHSMEYGPAPETRDLADAWLDRHERTFFPFIDGQFRPPANPVFFESINPRNREVLARVTACAEAEIDAAVEAAREAFPAPKLKCGVVWINCTNRFDAAAGFGGYRESGFGGEGGVKGMYEYLQPAWQKDGSAAPDSGTSGLTLQTFPSEAPRHHDGSFRIDRTPKLYVWVPYGE